MGKERSSLTKTRKNQEDVIVTFNGKNHRLKDWMKIEKAAVDDDASLNWRKVFEEHTPKPDNSESAPTGFVPYKKVKKKRLHKPNYGFGQLFKMFWIPFLSAVVVGLGIGFTVLLMFSDHKTNHAKAPEAPEAVATSAELKVNTLDGTPFSMTVQVLQENSYKTEAGAKEDLSQLKENEKPGAVLKENGNYKVIVGLAKDEATRKQLANTFGGMALYGKAFSFSPKAVRTSQQVGEFLIDGKNLMMAMVPLSTEKALGKKIDGTKLSVLNEKLNHWAAIDQLNVTGSLKKDLTFFRGAVESAYSHLEGKDDPDSAQQSLLDALASYQKIVTALNP